ncbi:hypothetical protein PHYSODRAFT_286098 [Phytophthora sojae]|uniref:RxLR effector protein n=2 Tax=Phytophthora sojae TaxID=67593 RepID=G4ZH34_PHYSP|nr:hypothetical protein PHYSODRAFT_286098 [Phytophthora sojae]AEK80863.1 Avh185 [Phytophthora sojae]AEK80864.1 Avh185 [Phytophthora sojae]AEK80865.1 Avh185 [Phytophthora sojae]EGZ18659.1 hypothetical protein PHYSODRAFT_286098 [Phytophthora sojae]|eukprot:XP_009527717.1 hypothetical protein PHYSODRAFT_286098 [Phytophthora sojae]
MRLLLWVLLATLVMLLSSTDAASAKLSSSASAKIDSDIPVRGLVAEYNHVGKRKLRGNELVAEDDDDEEERGLPVSSLLNRWKSSLQEIQRTTSYKIKKYLVEKFFRWIYRQGVNPVTLRARMMGKDNKVIGLYKAWYDKFVAANAVKP